MIKLEPWHSIGEEEIGAALRVLRSGQLSGFLGGNLTGGPEVVSLEREWAESVGARHGVAVNSATSGLLIALKAVGVEPGSRVIVSPYSMSAGVACVVWLGAIPVFADIGDDYCLDPRSVTEAIIPGTSAILTTNLFGNVAPLKDWPMPTVVDSAQHPFADGHSGDITVFSSNVHKPVNSGEGGVCTTDNDRYDRLMRLAMNHGELADNSTTVGLNLRMTEVTAAITREQLMKGRRFVAERNAMIKQLIEGIRGLPGTRLADHEVTCPYYAFGVRVHANIRDRIVTSLKSQGVPVKAGYGGPLYRLPAFRPYARRCPNCELIERELILMEVYTYKLTPEIIDQIIAAWRKAVNEIVREKCA